MQEKIDPATYCGFCRRNIPEGTRYIEISARLTDGSEDFGETPLMAFCVTCLTLTLSNMVKVRW